MRTRSVSALRLCALAALLAGAAAIRPSLCGAGGSVPTVYLARVDGVINPFSARYLERAIRETERAGAAAVVLELDTPGGLDSAMRDMIQAELNSHAPVIVYVAPMGARAASAGMFITIAAHLAAMAPGTEIGAAHPVSLSGGGQDEVMAAKVTEDAAATARAIAQHRKRNVEWAEAAVKESKSISAEEAMEKGVIEIIAPSLRELLDQADGRTVTTPAGETVLRLKGADIQEVPMGWIEHLLHLIADPNIAYILMTIGTLGIILELYHPGGLFPGIAGAICLLLGFAALGTLPVGWAGIGLLVLAVVFLLLELHTPGFGAFGIGALVAFIAGSLLLFVPITPPATPAAPRVAVNPWLVTGMTGFFALTILFIGQRVWAAQRMLVQTGREALIGASGQVVSPLAPAGTVRLRGEVWTARSESGPIDPDTPVRVARVDGVVLVVEPEAPGEEAK